MIRWITNYLGTAPWGEIAADQGFSLLDVRALIDGAGNSHQSVRELVEQGRQEIAQGRVLVICCDHGMSRSNAIAAGVLAKAESISFDDAVGRVLQTTKECAIHLSMLSTVREAIRTSPEPLRQSRRILVTGASGLVGSSLRARLPAESAVFTTRKDLDLVRDTVPLDLLVKRAEVSCVVHLAHPRIFSTSQAMGDALTMMKNVITVSAANDLRLVFLSCAEASSEQEPARADPASRPFPLPASMQGQTKWLCESLLRAYREEHGLNAAIIRSSMLYGPSGSRPRFLWNYISQALRHADITTHRYRDGLPAVDLLHVHDLCQALELVLARDGREDFDLGSGQLVTTFELAQRVVSLAGSRSSILQLEVARNLHNVAVNYSKIQRLFGWNPSVSLDQGLQDLVSIAARRLSAHASPVRMSQTEPRGSSHEH